MTASAASLERPLPSETRPRDRRRLAIAAVAAADSLGLSSARAHSSRQSAMLKNGVAA